MTTKQLVIIAKIFETKRLTLDKHGTGDRGYESWNRNEKSLRSSQIHKPSFLCATKQIYIYSKVRVSVWPVTVTGLEKEPCNNEYVSLHCNCFVSFTW